MWINGRKNQEKQETATSRNNADFRGFRQAEFVEGSRAVLAIGRKVLAFSDAIVELLCWLSGLERRSGEFFRQLAEELHLRRRRPSI